VLLAADAPAAAPSPPPAPAELPAEDIVLALRKVRIARDVGDAASEGEVLDQILAAHPDDVTCLAAALEHHRRIAPDSEGTRALRSRLLEALSRPGRSIPYPLLVDIAIDPRSSSEELSRLAEVLDAPSGEPEERVRRLKLRIDVLDRLGREDERLAETERLSTLDSDPSILWTLLAEYRRTERWEDLLRTLDRTKTDGGWGGGWARLEALAALGRLDELAKQAAALVDRMPRSGPPGSNPDVRLAQPNAVQGFFPTIFRLVDEGRTEAAATLAAKLEAASGNEASIVRLRVMLFGTPADRQAFLDREAATSLASGDAGKVRADADQRLLAKDFATAHGLYRRARELDAKSFDEDVFFWFNYGLSCIETSAWADAEEAMSRAIALDPKMSRALAHRARARVMLDRIPEGIADAQAALAIDPKSKHACYAMYLAYQKLGETTKAAEWLARFKTS
jgi:hypothetical protein